MGKQYGAPENYEAKLERVMERLKQNPTTTTGADGSAGWNSNTKAVVIVSHTAWKMQRHTE